MIALDQLLGLGLGPRRVAAGIAHHEFDLAAGHHVVPVLEEAQRPLLHLDAARGERAGLHGEEADAHRPGLGPRARGARGGSRDEDGPAGQEGTAGEGGGHDGLLSSGSV